MRLSIQRKAPQRHGAKVSVRDEPWNQATAIRIWRRLRKSSAGRTPAVAGNILYPGDVERAREVARDWRDAAAEQKVI